MNEQDQNYIKTHKAWAAATQLNAKEHEANIEYNKQKIDLLSQQICIDNQQLKLSLEYLAAGNAMFSEWCHNNGLDPKKV